MKRSKIIFIVVLALILCSQAWADIPKQINFQGILTDNGGAPLNDTTVSVEFRIYDSFTGGSTLWAETLNVTTDDQGRFGLSLGADNPIENSVFNDSTRFLGVKVETDAELNPRNRLVSVAYSHRVSTLDGAQGGNVSGNTLIKGAGLSDEIALGVGDPNVALELRSGTFGGNPYIDISNDDTADYDARIQLNGNTGLDIIVDSTLAIPSGNVGIGGGIIEDKLDISSGNIRLDDSYQLRWGNGTTGISANTASLPYYLALDANGEWMRITSEGRVGIGTTSPNASLHIRGGSPPRGIIVENDSGSNSDDLRIKRPGTESPGNPRFSISERSSNTDLWLYGYDGTTFKNFIGFHFPTNTVSFPADGTNLYIDNANSRVGIGTASPTAPLTIQPVSGTEVQFAPSGNNVDIFAASEFRLGTSNSSPLSLITNNSFRLTVGVGGEVGIGTTSPQGALDVSSTTGALIVPRMTTAQRDALSAVNGMIIYNTSTDQFNFREAGAWVTK